MIYINYGEYISTILKKLYIKGKTFLKIIYLKI